MDNEAKEGGSESAVSVVDAALLHLPDDVIYAILFYCDLQSLGRLTRVCKRFASLVRQECVWIWMSRRLTVVHDNRRIAARSRR